MESLYQRGEFRKRFEIPTDHPWLYDIRSAVDLVIIYLKGYYDMFSKQSTPVFVTWMIIGFLFLTLVLSVTRRKKNRK